MRKDGAKIDGETIVLQIEKAGVRKYKAKVLEETIMFWYADKTSGL